MCETCGEVFNQKTLLENHHASKHNADLPHPCNFCTRLFPSKTARNNHHYIAHKNKNNQLSFKCKECNVYFEMKEDLRIHSFIHFNGEIKTCLECEQIFKTNRLLKIHMQKHEEKQFQCPTCLDYFTFKTGLAKHIRMNRCRGPNKQQGPETIDFEMVKIATKQLEEVTNPSRKFPTKSEKISVMQDVKEESEESEVDDFHTYFPPNEVKVEKSEIEEPETATLENRKERKIRVILKQFKHRPGRPHLEYTCDYCGETVKYKKNMELHLKNHTINHKYKCRDCADSFKSRRKLVDHSLEVHGFKPQVVRALFTCDVCDRKFDVKSIFEVHKLSHDETARHHICKVCSKAFKSIGNLRRHEAIHAPTKDFQCSDCAKSFRTKLALKIHSEAVHAEMKVFVSCSVCSAIIQEKHLRIHMRNLHTDEGQEKPFSCTICLKTFKTEKLGQRHYESVHDPTDKGVTYPCPDCNLLFYRQRDLKDHSFTHYSGIIFQCHHCLKMFKNKRLLMIHGSIHEEENRGTFPCQHCTMNFKTRGGRRKHTVKLHSEVPVTEPNEKQKDFVS